MKNTKIMLLGIAVYIITWLLLGFIGYLLSDNMTFKEVITHSVILMIMVGLGWIPTLVVCGDYYDKY